MIEQFGLQRFFNTGDQSKGIRLVEPLGYLEFLHLNMQARLVITDSGGLQEETTVLGVPCLTLRPNTERPITCLQGTNQLVGNQPEAILSAARQALDGDNAKAGIPELWDGHAAERIVEVLLGDFQKRMYQDCAGLLFLHKARWQAHSPAM